ncbi:hypothetical protein Tco_1502763 [Tanacetum coccineum]
MNDLGEATFILGIKIYQDRSKRLIRLSQSTYMDKILKIFRMDTSKRGYIPMQEKLDLNKTQGASTPKEVKRMQNVSYASAVGSIMYATAVETILKSESNRDDIKSHTGYIFILNGGVVDWKISKQSTAAMSVTKAEYIATSKAAMEAVWIKKFISGLGIIPTINKPIKMLCDNSSALLIANEPGVQRGARHYHRRYHYVREYIKLGEINLHKVHKDDNLADPFTKALSKGKLTQHVRSMGLRLASSFISWVVIAWYSIYTHAYTQEGVSLIAKSCKIPTKLTYVGGLWVLLEMDSIVSKEKISKHVGVGSWFSVLQTACNSFMSDERIVWISIEGLSIKVLTHNSFTKIASIWGELADLEDSENISLSYKKLSVKTKTNVIINDKVKVIVKGKVHRIRVKELEEWSPKFIEKDNDYSSSDYHISFSFHRQLLVR